MTLSPEPTGSTHRVSNRPPPLPPRDSQSSEAPPPYSVMTMSSQDPRSSSTQSLVPDPTLDNAGRRRLLLVYIHGFMGNETSFRSFPAHVHNLVTVTLAESHVVHTKLYPRYKSRDALEVARDNFSAWLAPHEDPWTDVVLLGHSMGGLLAADITLVFRHRIIGVINFDVPFLGMHPGIVKAGLGSIFSPSPAPQDVIIPESDSGKRPSRMGTLFNSKPSDPNYNPSFHNDVRLPARKGWDNTLHWLSKHYADGLRQATKGLVKSHFEFGSAMADYRELKVRYAKVRALEEDDDRTRLSAHPNMRSVPRIRFVNYYTASTGRPKKPKSPKSPRSPSSSRPGSRQLQHRDSDANTPARRLSSTSQRSQNEESDGASDVSSQPEMTHVFPDPIPDSPRASIEVQENRTAEIASPSAQEISPSGNHATDAKLDPDGPSNLPQIPPIPKEPPFVDLMRYTGKAQRKAAEKEYDQALKEHQKAVKARNKIINERTRLQEKWDKEQEQGRAERQQRQAESDQRQAEARQRQAEADQRQKEAEQRMTDAERRQAGSHKQLEKSPSWASGGLEADLAAMHVASSEVSAPAPYGHYDFSRSVIMNQAPPADQASVTDSGHALSTTTSHASTPSTPHAGDNGPAKPKKLKVFCMLPPKDAQGNKDPTWVKVLMQDVDEVTAHTTLFFVNDTYERLVGDVGDRIEDWVREADSVRLVREMEGLN